MVGWILATIYSSLRENEKAIDYLIKLKNRESGCALLFNLVKSHPALDNIRNMPEYADVLKDVEAKYLRDHNRVGKLLKEKDLLE
ncbi:MAG TPA: hypothetical protein DCR40_15875 [Prolixibacteraceae bacterium]|nr:hypothetical protein [Prolixibacteraceae bacterium]